MQCRGFLARHGVTADPYHDTAGAARWLMFEAARGVGVIASPLAARLYGLEIVADDGAFGQVHVAVHDRAADAAVPADVHVFHEN